jgi:hypothetical protein
MASIMSGGVINNQRNGENVNEIIMAISASINNNVNNINNQ